MIIEKRKKKNSLHKIIWFLPTDSFALREKKELSNSNVNIFLSLISVKYTGILNVVWYIYFLIPFYWVFFFFLNPEIDRIKCNSSEIILNLSPDKEMFMIFHLALY